MFVTNIFDAKVVHAKVEPDELRSMFPEARHVGLFKISVACQTELEKIIGKDAGLWEAVHSFSDFYVDITINNLFTLPVMFDDIIGYQLQWHFHVLVLIERCFEIHIFDVCTAKFDVGHTNNAVPHDFR